MTVQNQYPNRIRELREKQQLTQAELAKLCDLDASTVARHETGSRTPSSDDIKLYAGVFKVDPIDVLTID